MIYSIKEKVEKSIRKSLGQVTQSSSGSLIGEFGGRGRGQAGGSGSCERSGLHPRKQFHWLAVMALGNQTHTKQWAPVTSWPALGELDQRGYAGRGRLQGFPMWVQAGKVLLPEWLQTLFLTSILSPNKADGNKHHGRPCWPINYRSLLFRSLKSRANLKLMPTAILRAEIWEWEQNKPFDDLSLFL